MFPLEKESHGNLGKLENINTVNVKVDNSCELSAFLLFTDY